MKERHNLHFNERCYRPVSPFSPSAESVLSDFPMSVHSPPSQPPSLVGACAEAPILTVPLLPFLAIPETRYPIFVISTTRTEL